jgi:hypothetical protein
MNGLIQELTNELKTNPAIKDSAVVRVVLESINNSALLGVPSDKILETSLNTLEELGTATLNENIKEVVAKFKKFAEKPTQRLANMAKEAGISMKIQMLKESNIAKDPAFTYTIKQIDGMLAVVPEFRVIGVVFEALNQFSYDPGVAKVLTDLTEYVNVNRAKLEILNAIFEMRQTSSVLYNEAIIVLEEALLAQTFGSDTIKMQMRGKTEIPIVNRLVNTLSMVEAKNQGKFNIGLGNGDAKVKAIIAPFHKISESSAIILVDNSFVKLTEDQDPVAATIEEAQSFPEFYSVCEAFARLKFQERDGEIFAKGRNLEIAFAVNETGNLQLKINGKTIDDLTKMDLSEVFLMEQMDIRANLVKIFNSLDVIVNLEFAKKIVNERLDKDSIVFTIGDNIFVFEKLGNGRIVKKMQGLAFHNYVMENFHYDVSEMYSIQLTEHDENLKRIDEEKNMVEKDIEKLELSVRNLDEALSGSTLTDEQKVSINDLRVSIEKNVNALKSHYITLDQAKKKA